MTNAYSYQPLTASDESTIKSLSNAESQHPRRQLSTHTRYPLLRKPWVMVGVPLAVAAIVSTTVCLWIPSMHFPPLHLNDGLDASLGVLERLGAGMLTSGAWPMIPYEASTVQGSPVTEIEASAMEMTAVEEEPLVVVVEVTEDWQQDSEACDGDGNDDDDDNSSDDNKEDEDEEDKAFDVIEDITDAISDLIVLSEDVQDEIMDMFPEALEELKDTLESMDISDNQL